MESSSGDLMAVYAKEVAYKVKPDLMNIIEKLGAVGISKCFDCGTCSVSCPFFDGLGKSLFPRKIIKYIKLGLEDKLISSVEPWLCLHCGECSYTCPKKAEPAETMMALRKYIAYKLLAKKSKKRGSIGLSQSLFSSQSEKASSLKVRIFSNS